MGYRNGEQNRVTTHARLTDRDSPSFSRPDF